MNLYYGRNTEAGIRRIAMERGLIPTPRPKPVLTASVSKPEHVPFDVIPEDIAKRLDGKGVPGWARNILTDVAGRHEVLVRDILGKRRYQNLVPARNELFYLVRTAFPDRPNYPSFPQMGRWFGREHTSILYAAGKHALLNGLPPVSALDVAEKLMKNRERSLQFHRSRRQAR